MFQFPGAVSYYCFTFVDSASLMACITLLSDFGLQDASVAAAKGILMQHVPSAQIIDISHLVEPFHLQQAAYLLLSAYRHFPAGSCHVLLFDVFFDRAPRLVLCKYDGHYFLAPDNGVLSLALGNKVTEVWQCYEHTHTSTFNDWISHIGVVTAKLQSGNPENLNFPGCTLKVAPQHWLPRVDGDTLECHVIHIDRYENVVINLTRDVFDHYAAGRPFRIQFMRDEELTSLNTHFYNVGEGQKLCRFNATGFLEIAINRGKAASLFGFKIFHEKHLIYNSIKIFFG